MPTKKSVPESKSMRASTLGVPSAFQSSGLRSIRKIYGRDVDEIRVSDRTERHIALTFGNEGERRTNIYMDELLTVIRRREQRTFAFRVPAKKPVAKKSASKAPAKAATLGGTRSHKQTFIVIEGEIRGTTFQTESSASDAILAKAEQGSTLELKSEKPIIPASIKKFTLYFFLNIRKLVCPKGNAKPNLSAGGAGMVGGLAVLIAGHFGIVADVAKAIASAVLILIVSATNGAFCDMTAEMAKAAIKKA